MYDISSVQVLDDAVIIEVGLVAWEIVNLVRLWDSDDGKLVEKDAIALDDSEAFELIEEDMVEVGVDCVGDAEVDDNGDFVADPDDAEASDILVAELVVTFVEELDEDSEVGVLEWVEVCFDDDDSGTVTGTVTSTIE